MKIRRFNIVIKIQLAYLLLCISWNAVGVWRVANGEQAIGPTSSLEVMAFLLFLGVLLSISMFKKWRVLYMILSTFICYLAVSAIVGSFLKDPTQWPSDVLRYSGVGINTVGILSFVILLMHWNNLKKIPL